MGNIRESCGDLRGVLTKTQRRPTMGHKMILPNDPFAEIEIGTSDDVEGLIQRLLDDSCVVTVWAKDLMR